MGHLADIWVDTHPSRPITACHLQTRIPGRKGEFNSGRKIGERRVMNGRPVPMLYLRGRHRVQQGQGEYRQGGAQQTSPRGVV